MCAGMGDSKSHQGRPGATSATGGEDGKAVALPKTAELVDPIQADRPDRLPALERQHPDNVISPVVLVDVRVGKERLSARAVHGDAGRADIGRTFCKLLIAEQAWQRAHPAVAMLASIPRRAI